MIMSLFSNRRALPSISCFRKSSTWGPRACGSASFTNQTTSSTDQVEGFLLLGRRVSCLSGEGLEAHLFPSREVPFLLGLEPGGLSPGAEGPPEDMGLVWGPPAVVAEPPPTWPSPEFCLLQYNEEEVGREPLWLKAEEESTL